MSDKIVRRATIQFQTVNRGALRMRNGITPPKPSGRTPRVSKMLALAIRFEQLIRDGHVKDQAEVARLGHVTRARLSQIMDLLLLAPDIQEEILCLPMILKGKDPISERDLRRIASKPDWGTQRRLWSVQRL